MDTLRSFFEEHVDQVMADVDPDIRSYLADLCCTFSDPSTLAGARGESGTPTLTWLYAAAVEAPPAHRLEAYRRLGDVALGVSGLFGPHLERRTALVGRDYYARMGRTAYGAAASLARGVGVADLLERLARDFRSFMDALARIARATTLPTVDDPGRLLQMLVADPSSAFAWEGLAGKGLIPCPVRGRA